MTYAYRINGVEITISRTLVGTAYARNGNVGSPTHYYTWSASVDGAVVASGAPRRGEAYEYARAKIQGTRYASPRYGSRGINVRDWQTVKDEMTANYIGLRP